MHATLDLPSGCYIQDGTRETKAQLGNNKTMHALGSVEFYCSSQIYLTKLPILALTHWNALNTYTKGPHYSLKFILTKLKKRLGFCPSWAQTCS